MKLSVPTWSWRVRHTFFLGRFTRLKVSYRLVTMASIIAPPPVRPGKTRPTRRGGKFYYTIHIHPNNAFAVRVNDESISAIVGFKKQEHALFIGKMIELHYQEQKEWPDMMSDNLVMPMPRSEELGFLFLQKWDFEDLKMTCTKNFLNMVSVDNIGDGKRGFNLSGDVLMFSAPNEFYVECLKEIYERPGYEPDP